MLRTSTPNHGPNRQATAAPQACLERMLRDNGTDWAQLARSGPTFFFSMSNSIHLDVHQLHSASVVPLGPPGPPRPPSASQTRCLPPRSKTNRKRSNQR